MVTADELSIERGREDGLTALLRRARSEFIEMPGLRLTTMQAARLWSLDQQTSERILQSLMAAGFLLKSRSGAYLRTDAV
jgi:hypothetical protein